MDTVGHIRSCITLIVMNLKMLYQSLTGISTSFLQKHYTTRFQKMQVLFSENFNLFFAMFSSYFLSCFGKSIDSW